MDVTDVTEGLEVIESPATAAEMTEKVEVTETVAAATEATVAVVPLADTKRKRVPKKRMEDEASPPKKAKKRTPKKAPESKKPAAKSAKKTTPKKPKAKASTPKAKTKATPKKSPYNLAETFALPIGKILKIAKLNEDIHSVDKKALQCISKVTEAFLQFLAMQVDRNRREKIMKQEDYLRALKINENFRFLRATVTATPTGDPNDTSKSPAKKRKMETTPKAASKPRAKKTPPLPKGQKKLKMVPVKKADKPAKAEEAASSKDNVKDAGAVVPNGPDSKEVITIDA